MATLTVSEGCEHCGRGMMTPFGDGDNVCVSCGWVKYEYTPEDIKKISKKQGRPKGYTRRGKTRLD